MKIPWFVVDFSFQSAIDMACFVLSPLLEKIIGTPRVQHGVQYSECGYMHFGMYTAVVMTPKTIVFERFSDDMKVGEKS